MTRRAGVLVLGLAVTASACGASRDAPEPRAGDPIAVTVAPVAAFNETTSASRTPGLSIARANHLVVSPWSGHTSERRSLKA